MSERSSAIASESSHARKSAALATWIGWYRPYATSHEDLDADEDLFAQVRNAALALAKMVLQIRSGAYQPPDQGLHKPRQK